MVIEVKKGGRNEYTCTGCGKPIAKGERHFRTGLVPYKRYHEKCVPVVKPEKPAPATVTAETPEPVTD